MDFDLTEEEQTFRKSVREFARRQLASGYLERATSDQFPHDAHRALTDVGLLSLLLPERLGGQGGSCVTAGIVAEEVGYADFNSAFLVLTALIAAEVATGSDQAAIVERCIAVTQGESVFALAVTEPDAGSDLGSARMVAHSCPDGWRLEGEKTSISLGASADLALVLARLNGQPRTFGLFLVPLDDPGVTRQRIPDLGFRPVGRAALHFEDVVVPRDLVVAADGRGFHRVMRLFDLSRPFLALMTLGAAQASLDETTDYVKTRHTFGRPIATYQGVAFPLVEHHTMVDAARLLSYRALWRRDRGLPHTLEASQVKWLAPEVAVRATHECVLLHGQVGYSSEAPLVQRMLDVMALEIGDGTAQVQKLVVARELLGREFRPY